MATYDFAISGQIPATPEAVYGAWLSSDGHSAMTGATAHTGDAVGDEFDAWDGYIHGINVLLEPPTRIVQTWRSAQFAESHDDSRIEVLLQPNDEGTWMTVRHSNVPSDQLGYENGGWEQSYFTPMREYFGTL